MKKVEALNELAQQRGETLAQMALAWVLKNDEVCSVLIGASTPEQIRENAAIVGAPAFSEEELCNIERISR